MKLDLIFVHVPKTGGSALRSALEEHFGSTLLRDYEDHLGDPTSPMNMDPVGFLSRWKASGYSSLTGKKAVFGHLWIKKYEPVSAHIRATVLREPIARALSHYYFLLSLNLDSNNGNFLWNYIKKYQLEFIDFCKMPFIRNYYTNKYFRDVDMRSFDVILDYNRINRDWQGALDSLGVSKEARRINETPGDEYKKMKAEVMQDDALMRELRSWLADDVAFYERWAS